MKGDFSRDSFDRFKNFRRVLMQQGRVQLDADWNELVSIFDHHLQTVAMDTFGPHAAPENDPGFEITGEMVNGKGFFIGKGRYYVNGILCENYSEEISYKEQPDYPNPLESLKVGINYLVYLDVWERPITCLEDDDIREKALGGSDTAMRTKTVWQVKVEEFCLDPPNQSELSHCDRGTEILQYKAEKQTKKACLHARAKREQKEAQQCPAQPESRYRGVENQLYRIEIHDCSHSSEGVRNIPSFKWSRENGAVVFPIKKKLNSENGNCIVLELENLGRDERFGLTVNDWVEIGNNEDILNNVVRPLLMVQEVNRCEMTVTLEMSQDAAAYDYLHNSEKPAWLRRWDQKKEVNKKSGVREIKESTSDSDWPKKSDWLKIEDGIEIQFNDGEYYHTGDYWLIPARTVLGDVQWPKDEKKEPKFMLPHGVMHHYAPLAIISVGQDSKVNRENDCRYYFKPPRFSCDELK